MTGVADIFQNAKNVVQYANLWVVFMLNMLPEYLSKRLRQQSWVNELIPSVGECPDPVFPDPRPTMSNGCIKEKKMQTTTPASSPNEGVAVAANKSLSRNSLLQPLCFDPFPPMPEGTSARWSLLLPVTSAGSTADTFWSRLESTLACLVESILPEDRIRTHLRVAFDLRDPILDTAEARARIVGSAFGIRVLFMEALAPAFEGKLCWIWDHMAQSAVADGAEFIILLGDDVLVETRGWQNEVEREFEKIALRRDLPFGAACVALRDRSFPAFPTFPVMHRFHLDAFKTMFPPEFVNQHGDPFLFETYRRFGASRFAPTASVTNTVGGAEAARYRKHTGLLWRGELLTRAVDILARKLPNDAVQVPCLDVVVPTYRCEPEMLHAFATLELEADASLNTLLVVDDPNAIALEHIKALASYAPDRVVRVYVMATNSGASMARNTGLAQSFGDYSVLLDDDVIPQPGLLDAYLGAIARRPDAVGFVGLTSLPKPRTRMERAILACRITFFYGIARVVAEPPWGVTANLCVRSRTLPIWFDGRFPKTGGGEDVEFCFELRKHGPLVSVPHAQVLHPFWTHPLKQVAGWASGDVLCLETRPNSTFRLAPNWIEIGAAGLYLGQWKVALAAALLEFALLFLSYAPETKTSLPVHERCLVGACATLPPMLQDAVRLFSKLRRCQFHQLCLAFDWPDGALDTNHVAATQLASLIKCTLLALTWLVMCEETLATRPRLRFAATCALCIGTASWCLTQRVVLRSPEVSPLLSAKLQLVQVDEPPTLHQSSNGHFQSSQPRNLPMNRPSNSQKCLHSTPFVILATQRTGSNLLCGLLHGVSSISMHSELFGKKAVHTHCGGVSRSVEAREADPLALLQQAFAVRKDKGGAVGFKLFPEHMTRRATQATSALLHALLRDPTVKKIILRRKDRLAVAVSAVRAQVSGEYIDRRTDAIRVILPPSEFEAFCDTYDDYYRFLDRATAGQRVLKLSYEDIVADKEVAVAQVCAFLGVPLGERRLREIFTKQASRVHPDRRDVVNWDQLAAAFRGTPRAFA